MSLVNRCKEILLCALLFYIPLCEGVQINHQVYHTVWAYVDCCCFALSKEQFHEILHEDVQLFHQTNEELPFIATGIEVVSELFNKYVFENSSNVELKEVDIRTCEDGISLKLLVEETKLKNGDVLGRFLFEENTIFQFSETSPDKISSIQTKIKRLKKENSLSYSDLKAYAEGQGASEEAKDAAELTLYKKPS